MFDLKINMLHHIVMWKLKDFAEDKTKFENARLIQEKFEDLTTKIKQIKKLEVGINIESSAFANFDVVLDTWFDNFPDMELYQHHPLHKEISDWIGKVRQERAAVDYET